MSIENNLELLWNSANSLQGDTQTHRLLKSYYINTCRQLTKNLQIPKEKFATSQMCPNCGTFWHEGEFGLKLLPKQLKNNSKTKKLLEKLKESDKTLTRSQRNRAKWLKKKISNRMAIKCSLCKHRSLINLEKPKHKSQKQMPENANKSIEVEVTKLSNVESSTKKSKKRKNKKNNNQIIDNTKIAPEPAKPEQGKILGKSTKKAKNKNTSVTANSKVVSKTQKQNSLLQLAALLQKQTKNVATNSAQDRLKSFLK